MKVNLKKEIALATSKILPVHIERGISRGMRLYGNLFYNNRPDTHSLEELLYSSLNLKGKVVIDVGAHIGIHTLYFASQTGDGRVISYEPNPANFYFLRKNVRVNSLRNVTLINMGLSDKPENLPFVSKRYVTATGSFNRPLQQKLQSSTASTKKLSLPLTTMDQSLHDLNLKQVDFIKIDTEGFELQVLKGMARTIRSMRPFIYFEIHGHDEEKKNRNFEAIFTLLLAHNYQIRPLKNLSTSLNGENLISVSAYGNSCIACDPSALHVCSTVDELYGKIKNFKI